MMAMTTSNSIKVKAFCPNRIFFGINKLVVGQDFVWDGLASIKRWQFTGIPQCGKWISLRPPQKTKSYV